MYLEILALFCLISLTSGSLQASDLGRLLVDEDFPQFQSSLKEFLLKGIKRRSRPPKFFCKKEMNNILLTLRQQFVVAQDAVAHHVLIPQCDCRGAKAFIFEYVQTNTTQPKRLRTLAQKALDKINQFQCSLFVKSFKHVDQVVKVGIAFQGRDATAVVHETENFKDFEGFAYI